MNDITLAPNFAQFKADVNDNWKMATTQDIIDAYTIATNELDDLLDQDITQAATKYTEMILDRATDELAFCGEWFTAPVSCLINALSLAIEEIAYLHRD